MSTIKTGRDFSTPHIYRNDSLSNVACNISAEPSDIYGWNIINPNSTSIYVKIIDKISTASIIVGTTQIEKTLLVPGLTTVVMGSALRIAGSQCSVNTGINIYCTDGIADSNTTAPILNVYVEIYFR